MNVGSPCGLEEALALESISVILEFVLGFEFEDIAPVGLMPRVLTAVS